MLLAFDLRVNASMSSLDVLGLGPDGGKHIAEALMVNGTVTELDLSWNSLGPDGAGHIVEAIKVNSTVTKLDLTHNDLDESSKNLLREAWRHGPGLLLD
jgi:hypothetical protein